MPTNQDKQDYKVSRDGDAPNQDTISSIKSLGKQDEPDSEDSDSDDCEYDHDLFPELAQIYSED
eukprot:11007013-Karenia_brevis.AAC.1